MDRKVKNDIILVLVLIAAAALVFFLRRGGAALSNGNQEANSRIVITVEDKTVFDRPVSELELPMTLSIDGRSGGSNVFIIDKNTEGNVEIMCSEADCPDRICVETGAVSVPDQPIVCLPHRVSAKILR